MTLIEPMLTALVAAIALSAIMMGAWWISERPGITVA